MANRGGHDRLQTIAHELRNRLSPLAASCQLIALEPENAEQTRELAAIMARQITELGQKLEELLEASSDPAPGGETADSPPEQGDLRPTGSLPAFRLLIVDDDRSASHLVARVLEKLGQHVQVAESGEEALALLPTLSPDAVISDISMPGLSGYELVAKIRRLPLARQPLIVALTGYSQSGDLREAQGAGFDRHLKKPADMRELRGIIEALTQR